MHSRTTLLVPPLSELHQSCRPCLRHLSSRLCLHAILEQTQPRIDEIARRLKWQIMRAAVHEGAAEPERTD